MTGLMGAKGHKHQMNGAEGGEASPSLIRLCFLRRSPSDAGMRKSP